MTVPMSVRSVSVHLSVDEEKVYVPAWICAHAGLLPSNSTSFHMSLPFISGVSYVNMNFLSQVFISAAKTLSSIVCVAVTPLIVTETFDMLPPLSLILAFLIFVHVRFNFSCCMICLRRLRRVSSLFLISSFFSLLRNMFLCAEDRGLSLL